MTSQQLSPNLLEAISRFEEYDELRTIRDNAGPRTQRYFDEPLAANRRVLNRHLSDPTVTTGLEEYLERYERDVSMLRSLGESGIGGVDNGSIAVLRDRLAEQETTPLHQLALFFNGVKGATEQIRADRARASDFLTRDAEIVAEELQGMTLTVNERIVVIRAVRPQDSEFNRSFVASRPIFGRDRCDAYVGATRGRFMLFLRAGDAETLDSCVAIMGVELDDGTIITKPTAVTKELGLTREMIGRARIDDNGVLGLDLTNRRPD